MEVIMNKQPELTATTKQNLIDAFWEIYKYKSIQNITVKEITEKAGYNRGTFYVYFKDVYELPDQIEFSLLPTIDDMDMNIMDFESSHPINKFIEMYNRNGKYLSVLLGENGDPYFQTKIKEHTKPLFKAIMNKQGLKSSIESDYAIEYLLSAMFGVMTYWFTRKEELPLEDFLSLLYKITKVGPMNILLMG